MIRCASAGVNLLHVAGSLRLSYTVAGKVSYTDRLAANARRFEGAVAERCDSVGGFDTGNMVDSAGADEFGWLKNEGFSFSDGGGPDVLTVSVGVSVFDGESRVSFESNDSGGRKVAELCGDCPLVDPCVLCWSPSIWSGSEAGRWPRGGASPCRGAESYEFDRALVNAGFGGR